MSENTTKSLQEVMEALAAPFPASAICWKPQSTTKDKKRGLAVPYADPRAYMDRLNEVVPNDWSDGVEFQQFGSKLACIVRLTILGVTRSGVGESPLDDENAATSAFAQGYKRANAEFGNGRYLYDLPTPWEDYDEAKRQFTEAAQARLNALYLKAIGAPAEPEPRPTKAGASGGKPAPEPKATAEPKPEARPEPKATPEPAPEARPEAEAKAGGNGKDEALAAALAMVIPFGKHRDKPLGELVADPDDHDYIGWLAGEIEFAGKTFEPRYGKGQQLAVAAKAVYASLQ